MAAVVTRQHAHGNDMSENLTPIATIPRPADVSAALRIVEQTEPDCLDPSRFARVGGEVVPLPPMAAVATSLENEDDAE